jgi:hypothetical protein
MAKETFVRNVKVAGKLIEERAGDLMSSIQVSLEHSVDQTIQASHHVNHAVLSVSEVLLQLNA